MVHFLTCRFFLLALVGAATVVPLQGCQRMEVIPKREPQSPVPHAHVDNDELTARVRYALEHSPVARSSNMGIESRQGNVLLTGMATEPLQIDLAVFVAQNVPGVFTVNSYMFSGGGPVQAHATADPVSFNSASAAN